MSEREIKAGSKWRNVHGEVGVNGYLPEAREVETSRCDAIIPEVVFRATHEWVSDPVETPKVGSWWRRRTNGESAYVITSVNQDIVRLECFGNYSVITPSDMATYFEPCDPPLLHAALKRLVEAQKGLNDSHWFAESAIRLNEFTVAAHEVARLYKAGER